MTTIQAVRAADPAPESLHSGTPFLSSLPTEMLLQICQDSGLTDTDVYNLANTCGRLRQILPHHHIISKGPVHADQTRWSHKLAFGTDTEMGSAEDLTILIQSKDEWCGCYDDQTGPGCEHAALADRVEKLFPVGGGGMRNLAIHMWGPYKDGVNTAAEQACKSLRRCASRARSYLPTQRNDDGPRRWGEFYLRERSAEAHPVMDLQREALHQVPEGDASLSRQQEEALLSTQHENVFHGSLPGEIKPSGRWSEAHAANVLFGRHLDEEFRSPRHSSFTLVGGIAASDSDQVEPKVPKAESDWQDLQARLIKTYSVFENSDDLSPYPSPSKYVGANTVQITSEEFFTTDSGKPVQRYLKQEKALRASLSTQLLQALQVADVSRGSAAVGAGEEAVMAMEESMEA